MMLSTFIYSFLFGNLASIVDDLTPKFQKTFENHYRHVLEYAKNSKLDEFIHRIHQYYNYIWQTDKGVDENEILAKLPNSIKSDLLYIRYKNVFEKSRFFKDEKDNIDIRIFYSFCKRATF
mmetsp:Transcript_15409/g.13142  ORF Transcript_15409/g.13142 Transcript_15409/m.13142 type:complete len:121 (-) Transcript_15409:1500-1862(-)